MIAFFWTTKPGFWCKDSGSWWKPAEGDKNFKIFFTKNILLNSHYSGYEVVEESYDMNLEHFPKD